MPVACGGGDEGGGDEIGVLLGAMEARQALKSNESNAPSRATEMSAATTPRKSLGSAFTRPSRSWSCDIVRGFPAGGEADSTYSQTEQQARREEAQTMLLLECCSESGEAREC